MSAPTLVPVQAAPCAKSLVREAMTAEEAAALSRGLKALADPTRLRLLSLIAAHGGGEACVCELTGPLDLSQPTISHHLKILREAGLVTSRRRGTWVHYTIVPGGVERVAAGLTAATAD